MVVRRRHAVLLSVVVAAAAITACSTHEEPLMQPCTTIVGRGVVGLPKVGLAPEELKLQQKC